ncbi:hypothetical protein BO70DRAFT_356812 [Aspergillus heteromorphus CBS 117.55]|uniref:Uncharacterized protein n=1 Tax=Aspergillus heteromorphus CBS 117.55 TaxID=1448321 RepID=A0A317UXJ0_9EURO|nr:uncharacterized protein BO70DRAFT_356812 [Aspergillus heteromorphus CBS 117.55]PWY65222.1 hypothetical protein BO70DRAFT_356812 [Aspergillus heteromorphus CBS 117.55]
MRKLSGTLREGGFRHPPPTAIRVRRYALGDRDSMSLRAELIHSIRNWLTIAQIFNTNSTAGACSVAPVEYPENLVRETLALERSQYYNTAKEVAYDMKARMLEAANIPEDVAAVRDQFPFEDFDEST